MSNYAIIHRDEKADVFVIGTYPNTDLQKVVAEANDFVTFERRKKQDGLAAPGPFPGSVDVYMQIMSKPV